MGGQLARRSQISADRMEKITEEMRSIAKKTERETVSMRIVTLVTLIFLPGTFISVCAVFSHFFCSFLFFKIFLTSQLQNTSSNQYKFHTSNQHLAHISRLSCQQT